MNPIRWAVATLVTGLVAGVGTTAAYAGSIDDALAPFHHQPITWHQCQVGPDDTDGQFLDQFGAQCADITVPLDYNRPAGRTITLALSRLVASDQAHRIGALVFNLGGPSIPALPRVVDARFGMGDTGARFDLIGLDPRFVGRSTPLDCGWPTSWQPRSPGLDRRGFDQTVALTRDLAERCADRQGDLLPYASTANIARDMDVVRAALGEPKLSFLGYSYGTYIGALYSQLFPGKVDRMVLDSAIDPAHPGVDKGDNGPQRDAALHDWAGWAAARDAQYHLGATADQVMSTVDQVYRTAARQPLKIGQYQVDDTVVPALLLDPLSDDSDDNSAMLADRVQTLAAALASGAAPSTPDLDQALAGLLTGALSAMHSAGTAIMCGDAAVSRDPEQYWNDIEARRQTAPFFGPVAATVTPCAFWPTTPTPQIRVANHVPALVVSAAGDINAILSMGQAMHRALAGSRMVTLDGVRTHGVYLFKGNGCVDDTVNAYLNTGTLPTTDLTCS